MKFKCFVTVLMLGMGAHLFGQTAFDLSAKYRALSAYEVRPGVLMTAKYARNGQACEITLQRYHSENQPDGDDTIAPKLEEELINELAPESERGPEIKGLRWRGFLAGGQSHIERDFVNVLVVEDGTYSCEEGADGKLNCSKGGTKMITIHWKSRTCGDGNEGARKREGDEGAAEAGKESKAGGSPEGDGQSAPFGEFFGVW